MILKNYRKYFSEELSDLYPETEIDSFFFLLTDAYLELQRIDLILHPDFEIDTTQLQHLNTALKRLQKEEPIQYILGRTEFYGLPILVNKQVLIPRPETEELVHWIIEDILSDFNSNSKNILDIGTGSGCIAIALAKHISDIDVTAIDISKKALIIARQNAALNQVKINFLHMDILSPKKLSEKYDIIVSNPPYVRESEKAEMSKNVLNNEPHLALFVKNNNPLLFYDTIASML